CHAPGQNQKSSLLQGRQGPLANDRADPRSPGQASRSNVLQHLPALERSNHSQLLRRSLGHRSHLREQQTTAGFRGSGQSYSPGRSAHCPHGLGVVQPQCAVVSPSWLPARQVSRPSLVSAQGRTFVRRHLEYLTAFILGGEKTTSAAKNRTAQKSPCPDDRFSQPLGLSGTTGCIFPNEKALS